MYTESAHLDTFPRDNLPPIEKQPEFLLGNHDYPKRFNVGVELCDRLVAQGHGQRTALAGWRCFHCALGPVPCCWSTPPRPT